MLGYWLLVAILSLLSLLSLALIRRFLTFLNLIKLLTYRAFWQWILQIEVLNIVVRQLILLLIYLLLLQLHRGRSCFAFGKEACAITILSVFLWGSVAVKIVTRSWKLFIQSFGSFAPELWRHLIIPLIFLLLLLIIALSSRFSILRPLSPISCLFLNSIRVFRCILIIIHIPISILRIQVIIGMLWPSRIISSHFICFNKLPTNLITG